MVIVQIRYVKNPTKLFKGNGLSLEIECNRGTVNYLDITLDLNTGTYRPYAIMEHFLSTQNPITLQIFSNSYLYQSKLDYLTFPVMLFFSFGFLKETVT